jgi:NAD(P)-dependent dehydrogenase (short-subunit alcohol dehydrogenase family)
MVPYADILNSNSSLKSTGASPTAVFVGATAGIGRGALLALAKHTTSPKIYIVGRSQSTLDSLISALKSLNPDGTYIPIEGGDLTLLSTADKASEAIKAHEKAGHVDLLIMSMGYVTFAARTESSEGLDKLTSIRYYARMRFLVNLLPLLNAAPSPRVVSVLAAGREGQLWPEDFALRETGHYSVVKAAGAAASMTTLFFEEMGKGNPKMVFVHLHPGTVASGTANRPEHFGWAMRLIFGWVLLPLIRVFGYTVEESGERVLFAATSGKFRAVQGGGEGIEVGSDGKRGSGTYLVVGDSTTKEGSQAVKEMREKGLGQKVIDHTMGEFERIANL